MPAPPKLPCALGFSLAILLIAWPAAAHSVGLSKGSYVCHGVDVIAELTFARPELVAAIGSLDVDGDGTLDESEISRGQAALAAAMVGGVSLESDGRACEASFDWAAPAQLDGVDIRMTYRCPSPPSALRLRFGLLDRLSSGHRHVAHLELGSAVQDDILHGARRELEVRVEAVPPSPAPSGNVPAWVRMGLEHILTGYDHLVFLFGLVLIGGRVRSLVGAVTAFTVAHTLTLAMAVLGVWSPPARLVEMAIAGSIVWVGVENLFVQSARGRWRLTLPFGLVHGFGFARALREIALPRAQVPLALVSFNVGVELGQLAVMAVLIPVLVIARARGWLGPRGTRALSVCVAGAGGIWLVRRAIG
jgi:hydrogenase/urease accessory protein HupE